MSDARPQTRQTADGEPVEPLDDAMSEQSQPFKPFRAIFDQETQQAVEELKRPNRGLFLSGLLAGFGVGFSVLALAVTLSLVDDTIHPLVVAILLANAYTVGFILVIMGRTDLFTEYTTIALFPVLTGQTHIAALLRLWAIVYVSNLVGGTAFAGILVTLGPAMEITQPESFGEIARHFIGRPGWVSLLSAFLAGWLMGLLSWLVTSGRESISQIFFIWIITFIIGLGQLQHAITGAIEVIAAWMAVEPVTIGDFGRFLFWTTLGNAVGGVLFAVLIRYSVLLSGESRARSGDSE